MRMIPLALAAAATLAGGALVSAPASARTFVSVGVGGPAYPAYPAYYGGYYPVYYGGYYGPRYYGPRYHRWGGYYGPRYRYGYGRPGWRGGYHGGYYGRHWR